jgi:hypothetical protein
MAETVATRLDEAEELIKQERPFRLRGGSSLRGVTEAPGWLGLLPPEHSEGIENAEYVVMSYDTPIAWVIDGEKFLPDVGYSPTTGQHQYLVADAWGLDFSPARGRKVVRPEPTHEQCGRERRLRSGGVDGPGRELYSGGTDSSGRELYH